MIARTGLLELRSELRSVVEAQRLLEALVEEYPEIGPIFANVHTVLTEAVLNAVIHGNEAHPERRVRVAYRITSNVLSFEVSDEGKGFDYEAVLRRSLTGDTRENRGLYLINSLSDRLRFDKGGRNLVVEFDILSPRTEG